jgi:hypothetical protein
MAGKPNKDFLAKPKGSRKRSMTIDNVKDQTSLAICPIALNKLMSNLTLILDKEETKALNTPIKEAKMLVALVNTPKGKSPGMDRLPYECYQTLLLEATNNLTNFGNQVLEKKAQPVSS